MQAVNESLDLQAFPGCSSSPSPSSGVTPRACRREDGLIQHSLFDSREDVTPGKFTLSQGFALLQRMLSRVGRERRDEACEGSISAHIVFCHDERFRDAKAWLKWSTMVDTRGRHMTRLATNAESAMPSTVRRPTPPQETPVVTCHQEWSGKS